MIEVKVRDHYSLDAADVIVPTKLRECAGSEVDDDVRGAALHQLAATPLYRV